MNTKSIKNKYEFEWKKRLERIPNESFFQYERNLILPYLFRNKEIFLDLASGNAIVGEYAQKVFKCDVVAFDISKTALLDAKKRGIKGIVGSLENKLPFKNNSFDTVFWGDNIEHVFDPAYILKEVYRILKPKGRVILSTPNLAYWRYRFQMFFTGEIPKTEGENNKPWEWTHIRFFTRGIIKEILKISGFKEKSFYGISRRRLDKPFLNILPELFGMIMVIEAEKIVND